MQFLITYVAVTLLALPALPLTKSGLFGLAVLAYLTIGQFLIALLFGAARKVLGSPLTREGVNTWDAFRVALSTIILAGITLRFDPYLIIPAMIGVTIERYFYRQGERKYQKYIEFQKHAGRDNEDES